MGNGPLAGAARVFAVARGTVNRWMRLVEQEGRRALKARRRGRPRQSRLAPHQAAATVRMIPSGCPDQLSLPFALWTREAVQQLLARKFDVGVSVWTVGRYLRAWGLTPQKLVRRAYEQNPVAVRKWLIDCFNSEEPWVYKSDHPGEVNSKSPGFHYRRCPN